MRHGFKPPLPTIKLKLQGSYAGFGTDDFVAYTKQGEKEAKLLAQIKHDASITKGNENFVKTVHRAWNDFNNTSIFCLRTEDLDKPHLDNVFSAIALQSSLAELEAGLALIPKKYLLMLDSDCHLP